MVRRALPLVLLALLTLTAGCNGLTGDARSAAPDREPFGVDQPLGSFDAENGLELPPGLTTAGFEDVSELIDRHTRILESDPYTVHREVTVENDTHVFETERTMATDLSTERAHLRGVQRGTWPSSYSPLEHGEGITIHDSPRFESWIDGPTGLTRNERAKGTVEYEPAIGLADDGISGQKTNAGTSPLFPYMENGDTTVETELIAGATYYVIDGSGEFHQWMAPSEELTVTREFTFRAYVRDDGLIRQTTIEQTRFLEEENVTTSDTTTIQDLGETTVERPGWYEEALGTSDNAAESR